MKRSQSIQMTKISHSRYNKIKLNAINLQYDQNSPTQTGKLPQLSCISKKQMSTCRSLDTSAQNSRRASETFNEPQIQMDSQLHKYQVDDSESEQIEVLQLHYNLKQSPLKSNHSGYEKIIQHISANINIIRKLDEYLNGMNELIKGYELKINKMKLQIELQQRIIPHKIL
ncbi:Hypothetical_protein [Hexamita inflata]|uniref:Hypothetical_protein n=1 Tax=Hexamita inflata TaxID=28002 RepID=A0AA86TSJ2_9EUKA|nr:Hypothetical protein HINF_LOCUS14969 [Hexamita inflata]